MHPATTVTHQQHDKSAAAAALPFVSVIVPVYNDTARLQLCLDALERQSYADTRYEVIVVDNGSSDTPAPVVGAYERAVFAVETRRGSYAARNAGLRLARGSIVAFTDSDCLPALDWIERGVERLRKEPDCGLLGGRIDVFVRDPANPTALELYELVQAFPQRRFTEQNHFAATANVFAWRATFERVGPFDAALKSSGDREWGRRVHEAGYRVVYADEVVVRHPARATWDEAYQKNLRVIGGFRDYYSRKKLLKGLVREALPAADARKILRHPGLKGWRQRALALGMLLRLRWLRIRLRLRVLLGLSIGAGR